MSLAHGVPTKQAELARLLDHGMFTAEVRDYLELAIQGALSLVVSGPAGSGKSSLLNALVALAHGDPRERVAIIEQQHAGALHGPPDGLARRRAVVDALRQHPTFLVVDDVAGAEALEILSSLAPRSHATLCGLSATSVQGALADLRSGAAQAAAAPGATALNTMLATGVHAVVQLQPVMDGMRRIASIQEMAGLSTGADGSEFLMIEIFTTEDGVLGWTGQPSRHRAVLRSQLAPAASLRWPWL